MCRLLASVLLSAPGCFTRLRTTSCSRSVSEASAVCAADGAFCRDSSTNRRPVELRSSQSSPSCTFLIALMSSSGVSSLWTTPHAPRRMASSWRPSRAPGRTSPRALGGGGDDVKLGFLVVDQPLQARKQDPVHVHEHDADAAVVVRMHCIAPGENHSVRALREP